MTFTVTNITLAFLSTLFSAPSGVLSAFTSASFLGSEVLLDAEWEAADRGRWRVLSTSHNMIVVAMARHCYGDIICGYGPSAVVCLLSSPSNNVGISTSCKAYA